MTHAVNSLDKAVKLVNLFFDNKWKDYSNQIDKLEYSEFKEIKQF
jgi:hypothetical protein